jgi:hypothetical protein
MIGVSLNPSLSRATEFLFRSRDGVQIVMLERRSVTASVPAHLYDAMAFSDWRKRRAI